MRRHRRLPNVRTPNIDRLGREGVRLTDAYANGAVCTLTRAAHMSGRYQQRVGLEWVLTVSATDRERGLPALETSLPALLETTAMRLGSSGSDTSARSPSSGRTLTDSTSARQVAHAVLPRARNYCVPSCAAA